MTSSASFATALVAVLDLASLVERLPGQPELWEALPTSLREAAASIEALGMSDLALLVDEARRRAARHRPPSRASEDVTCNRLASLLDRGVMSDLRGVDPQTVRTLLALLAPLVSHALFARCAWLHHTAIEGAFCSYLDSCGEAVVAYTADGKCIAATMGARRILDRLGEREPYDIALLRSQALRGCATAFCRRAGDTGELASATLRCGASVIEVIPVRCDDADRGILHLRFLDTARASEAHLDALTAAAPLSPRERDISRELLAGRRRSQIASRLGISDETVKWYASRIYAKLRVSGRDGLLRRAMRLLPDAGE